MSRKIIEGTGISIKDDNGAYMPSSLLPKKEEPKDPPTSDINLSDLMEKHLLLLYRETRALLMESATGKLSKDSAHSMRENLKLIVDLKKKEKDVLSSLSTEELEALVNEKANQ